MHFSGTELGDSSRFILFSLSESVESVQENWFPVVPPGPSISDPL